MTNRMLALTFTSWTVSPTSGGPPRANLRGVSSSRGAGGSLAILSVAAALLATSAPPCTGLLVAAAAAAAAAALTATAAEAAVDAAWTGLLATSTPPGVTTAPAAGTVETAGEVIVIDRGVTEGGAGAVSPVAVGDGDAATAAAVMASTGA